jgi:hypothetical protein
MRTHTTTIQWDYVSHSLGDSEVNALLDQKLLTHLREVLRPLPFRRPAQEERGVARTKNNNTTHVRETDRMHGAQDTSHTHTLTLSHYSLTHTHTHSHYSHTLVHPHRKVCGRWWDIVLSKHLSTISHSGHRLSVSVSLGLSCSHSLTVSQSYSLTYPERNTSVKISLPRLDIFQQPRSSTVRPTTRASRWKGHSTNTILFSNELATRSGCESFTMIRAGFTMMLCDA